jgi:putative flippase GtrA
MGLEREAVGPIPLADAAPSSAVAGHGANRLGDRIWTETHRRAWLKTRQARRFVVVGGLNTLVDYVLFVGLTKLLHLPLDSVWVAKLISGTVAISISFFLNRRWVFGTRGGPVHHQAARFLAATAVGVYCIQAPLTQLFAGVYQWPGRALYSVLRDFGLAQALPGLLTEPLATKTAAFVLATCFSMTFNFLAYRYWVFRQRPAS